MCLDPWVECQGMKRLCLVMLQETKGIKWLGQNQIQHNFLSLNKYSLPSTHVQVVSNTNKISVLRSLESSRGNRHYIYMSSLDSSQSPFNEICSSLQQNCVESLIPFILFPFLPTLITFSSLTLLMFLSLFTNDSHITKCNEFFFPFLPFSTY